MRNLIAVCVVVLAVGSAAFAEPELKGTPSELTAYLQNLPRLILLTGESKVEIQADKAIVDISIKTENSSLEACLKSNQTLRANMTAKLTEAGIPADKITAEKFSSTPRYGFFGKKPNNYEVRNLVRITVTDEKDFQQIAKLVDQYPEIEYKGLNFKHSNEQELKKQATEKAFDDMLKKKAEYEKKFNVTLNLRSFSEQTLFPQVSQTYDAGMKAYSGGVVLGSRETSKSAVLTEEAASPFGELVFAATVSGEFELKVKE